MLSRGRDPLPRGARPVHRPSQASRSSPQPDDVHDWDRRSTPYLRRDLAILRRRPGSSNSRALRALRHSDRGTRLYHDLQEPQLRERVSPEVTLGLAFFSYAQMLASSNASPSGKGPRWGIDGYASRRPHGRHDRRSRLWQRHSVIRPHSNRLVTLFRINICSILWRSRIRRWHRPALRAGTGPGRSAVSAWQAKSPAAAGAGIASTSWRRG
jgi:hypothetical protein